MVVIALIVIVIGVCFLCYGFNGTVKCAHDIGTGYYFFVFVIGQMLTGIGLAQMAKMLIGKG